MTAVAIAIAAVVAVLLAGVWESGAYHVAYNIVAKLN